MRRSSLALVAVVCCSCGSDEKSEADVAETVDSSVPTEVAVTETVAPARKFAPLIVSRSPDALRFGLTVEISGPTRTTAVTSADGGPDGLRTAAATGPGVLRTAGASSSRTRTSDAETN